MTIELKAPTFPESVQDGTVATWHKKAGDAVSRDEVIVDIETDKVVLEVVAPVDGVVGKIVKDEGEVVLSNEVIGSLEAGAGAGAPPKKSADKPAESSTQEASSESALANPAAKKLADEK